VFSGNKKIAVKNIGLRPGEKMYENLMTEEEAKNAFETETSFIVLSEIIPSNYKSEENKQKRLKKTALRNYCSKEIEPLSKEKLKMLLIKEKII
jgi:FlaA1/EpsC-like NDP-sugar epimerase